MIDILWLLKQGRPKDGAENAACSNMSTGTVDINEAKSSQRHLLAAIENNLGASIKGIKGKIMSSKNVESACNFKLMIKVSLAYFKSCL